MHLIPKPLFCLHLSISNGFVSSKIYDTHDDFDFDIVHFPVLDGDVSRSISYGDNISQIIRFARVSSLVTDFNARNEILTAKIFHQGYRYHKLRKAFFQNFIADTMNWFQNSRLIKMSIATGPIETRLLWGLDLQIKKNC